MKRKKIERIDRKLECLAEPHSGQSNSLDDQQTVWSKTYDISADGFQKGSRIRFC